MDTEDKKQTKQNSKEIYTINIVQVVFDIEDNKPNQTEQNSNHKKTIANNRDNICHSRHCRRQCKSFASGVNFSRKNTFPRESRTQISG